MKKNSSQKKGFTLIELLVVISIIGVLAAAVLVSVKLVKVKARNAVRLAEVDTLITAFNLATNDGASLPVTNFTGLYSSEVMFSCLSEPYSDCSLNANTATQLLSFGHGEGPVNSFLVPYLPTYPSDPPGGTRMYSGYLYSNPYNLVPLDSTKYGAYIFYFMERPGSCGKGIAYSGGADIITCVYRLDPK